MVLPHGRLLLGAATASGMCYLLWRYYRRRHLPGARLVASERLQLDEEADTSLRRHSRAAIVSSSTTRSLRLHPDRPCRYDGFVRPRSETVFQLELPASRNATGVQVRALDASGDSLRLYWREGEAARPAEGVYDGCCTHPPLAFEWRAAAAGQAAEPGQSRARTLHVTLLNQQGPQAVRCSVTATLLVPERGRVGAARPPPQPEGGEDGTPKRPPSDSTPSIQRLAKRSIVPQVPNPSPNPNPNPNPKPNPHPHPHPNPNPNPNPNPSPNQALDRAAGARAARAGMARGRAGQRRWAAAAL